MTIPEASNLVLQAAEMSIGGEVFILDMGDQIKIYDLAEKLIHLSGRNISSDGGEGIEIKEVGLRAGEKMYEELLISGAEEPTENKKIFKSNEDFVEWDELQIKISCLEDAVLDHDHNNILKLLMENVEGFNRSNSSINE
jgi:FlaA1/EpsC-like NDP-sugar epimerase